MQEEIPVSFIKDYIYINSGGVEDENKDKQKD